MESISPVRISTASLFDQQTTSIENLLFTQAQYGTELSTGKKLNQPSDDPTQIAQDLLLRTQTALTTQSATNFQQANGELTTVDSTLGEVTSSLQSVRQLTVEAANDTVDPQSRASIGQQIEQIIEQMVSLANTNYGGQYLFAGTSTPTVPPVQAVGSPPTSVTFSGNEGITGQLGSDGTDVSLSTTLQQAFNFNASDGSLNIFQVLINLRNALDQTGPTTLGASGQQVAGTVIDQSASSVNGLGVKVDPNAALTTQLNNFSTPLVTVPLPPGGPPNNVAFEVDGYLGNAVINFDASATTLDGGPASVVGLINAQTANTGVTATWDQTTQKLTLSSIQPYKVSDVTGNFTASLQLAQQADVVENLSRSLGDIDNILAVNLTSRAQVGSTQQTLSTLNSRYNTTITNNTATQSNIEDVNFPTAYSAFAQAQTALQSAYATTTRLEGKTLFDYL